MNIKKILYKHNLWLNGDTQGERADLFHCFITKKEAEEYNT